MMIPLIKLDTYVICQWVLLVVHMSSFWIVKNSSLRKKIILIIIRYREVRTQVFSISKAH